jgi:hypothetical protein
MAIRSIDEFSRSGIDNYNKRRVVNWILDYIKTNPYLAKRFKKAVILTKKGFIKEAILETKEILKLLSLDGSDPRGYIVGHCLRNFGISNSAIVFYKTAIRNIRTVPKDIKQSRITKNEVKEFDKGNLEKYFTIVEGKRKEGIIEPILKEGKIEYRFVDVETRKYVPQTQKVKKEIERLKSL